MTAPATDKFNVILVGAGEINFGSPEGPWNHSARLESILGSRLYVLAIVDPDLTRCEERISERRKGAAGDAWATTIASKSLDDARSRLEPVMIVHLIILGCPPHFRGSTQSGRDMDTQVIKSFPQAKAILIEKPVAALAPEVAHCDLVAESLRQWSEEQSGAIVSVGYMLRYLSAVKKIKQILADHNLTPSCINARYYMAYEYARKMAWWNKEQSCGPVVEQATHFVDLVRYIAGVDDNPVRLDTVRAIAVEHNESAGQLSKLGIDEENTIEPSNRIPRVTNAFWKHEKGTLGTLCHAITLHDCPYDTELEVLADGWVIKLKAAYSNRPILSILSPDSKEAAHETAIEDDPFYAEIEAIVCAVDGKNNGDRRSQVLSSFQDALQTYELTWRIRRASENTS